MNDRELLELAAKAAGHSTKSDRLNVWLVEEDGSPIDRWNPLADDAQALRLAVKLGMFLELFTDEECLKDRVGSVMARVFFNENSDSRDIDEVFNVGDPYAATRRAIVRAAAEIGTTRSD